VFEELWNYGFPQEMSHFARCVRGKESPQATGEDGRLVQEVLCAGYQSAGIGAKVHLPFRPKGVARPIDLCLRGSGEGWARGLTPWPLTKIRIPCEPGPGDKRAFTVASNNWAWPQTSYGNFYDCMFRTCGRLRNSMSRRAEQNGPRA